MSDLVKFAAKNGADDIAIETVKSRTSQIKFANNSAVAAQNWDVTRHNVFVAVKNATAYSSFYKMDDKRLETAVKRLILAAKRSKPSSEYFGLAKGSFKYSAIKNAYDKKIIDYNGADAINAAINAAGCRSAAGFFSKSESERTVETSNVSPVSEKKTEIQMSIRAINEPEESGHSVSCSSSLKGFDPEQAGREAGEIAKLAKRPGQGKPGKYEVVFAPMAIGNLLSRVGEFAAAFNVDSGFSCLGNKIGKSVASSMVSITDSGRLENGFNSSMFDDEGVPTMDTKIIDRGILKSYLHNTSSAKRYKSKTTANAGIISQRYHNLVVEPGRGTKEELLGIKNGLYVTNVWYTRFQSYYTGDFSTIPRDGILVIKNGSIEGSVKNVRITDNILKILQNVSGLSSKLHCVDWWEEVSPAVYTPHIRVKDVNVTLPTM